LDFTKSGCPVRGFYENQISKLEVRWGTFMQTGINVI
jgi:hypothetical protein